MRIEIAKTDKDIRAVAELATVIWHEHFASILSPGQIDYMVKKYQSYPAIKAAIENDGYRYYMAYDGDDLCGYLGIHDEGGGVIFISKVYVRADKRKKGIATELLSRLEIDYPAAKKWYLTVNRHNDGPIAVYEKRGFHKARTQVADIGNGYVMDDYVMEKDFISL